MTMRHSQPRMKRRAGREEEEQQSSGSSASAELDSHSKRNGRCENCLPNSLLQQRMLAHTMDRCVLAVEHSFGCGTMRMHWKLQSVRPTPTTSTATQESTAVSGTKSKCLLVLQRTCGTRHDLHLCEHRQLSTLKSHRPSDVCHIKSAAQRTTERDAVFWFVPQQTGGTAHRREERRFSSLYRNKLVVQSGHKRHIERKDQHTAAREKPRKEEEPSSTAAHSPQAHLHRTRARTQLFFVWMHALAPRKMRPLEAAGAHTGA